MIKGTAIILTGGSLDDILAKTAHGLIRSSERFQTLAIIDARHARQDAGEMLDGQHRNIPIFAQLADFFQSSIERPDYCVIGIASVGGRIPRSMFPQIKSCIEAGISIVSGLHEFLSDQPELVALAQQHQVQLIDIRKPKKFADLHFWDGSIQKVACPIIPVMGTDCATGKRTTALFLQKAARARGLKAEMVFTGQTGWMQSGRYGFIFDSTLNDFVSGELEHAIVSCWENEKPDLILIEGQASLRNPSGPCGSEFLVSGGATGVILVHPPTRVYHKGWQHLERTIAPIESEMALIKAYGVPTLGLALNTSGLSLEEAKSHQQSFRDSLGIPVALPIEEGVEELLDAIL
jgi:uncharacterized NAD-dependent epimerase/dehydratase family protein